MWRIFAFACDYHADVSDSQRVARLDRWCTTQRDKDALRCSRAVVDVGAAAVRSGLDHLAALDQPVFPFIHHPEIHVHTRKTRDYISESTCI